MFRTQRKMFADICLKTNYSFDKGSLVACNADHCYISYSQFIKRHPEYAIRFAYKCFPKADAIYRILGVYTHVMEDFWDVNDYVVVVEDTKNRQIFLMGELGLTPIPDKIEAVKTKLKKEPCKKSC